MLGRKRVFLSALLNGITLGGLYFLVASGFTLIFGLMRNVNLAHGSLYLFGGYFGYEIADLHRRLAVQPDRRLPHRRAARHRAAVHDLPLDGRAGPAPDAGHHRDLDHPRRPDAVALGRRLLPGADAGLAGGPVELPLVTGGAQRAASSSICNIRWCGSSSSLGAVVIGILMWLALNRTKIGMLIRAGVDDRDMLSATGVRVQLIFLLVFAFGAGLAGFAGVVGGTFQSLQPGEDIKILLASLVVVIVGGMGSITGAAVGARADRARRAVRLGLHADLRGRAHLRHHGGRAGRAAAGPVARALSHGAGRSRATRLTGTPPAARLEPMARAPGRIRRSGCSRCSC